MNTQHTPTPASPLPWHQATGEYYASICSADRVVLDMRIINGKLCNDDEARANAAYIVTACNAFPSLVAALEACTDALATCYDVLDYPCNGRTSQDAALAEARAALAKAQGGVE